ncbi:anosmin-1-like [Glandiceps talaboti]
MAVNVSIFLAISFILPTCVAQIVVEEAILQAQCKSRCLSLHTHRLNGETVCEEDTKCAACLKPCQGMYKNLSTCMSKCESIDDDECFASCEFIKTIHKNKAGECPNPEEATAFAAACLEECAEDMECGEALKCCPNTCGHTCQEPVDRFKGTPALPPNHPFVILSGNKDTFIVTWLPSPENNSSDVIVYSLEMRGNIGEHASHAHMWDWQTVAQSTDVLVTINTVLPGRWYEFRVSAVNMNGTQGYTESSIPMKLEDDPNPPGPPRNITQGKSEYMGTGKVNTYILWEEPKYSVLPIVRYRVYYSRRLKMVRPMYVPLQEHRRHVPGDQHYIKLENLHIDTEYFIQIQAFSQWGKSRLRSERTSKTILTPYIAQSDGVILPGDPTGIKVPSSMPPGPLDGVTVERPFWHHDKLKAHVSWGQPKTGAKATRFMIYWGATNCIGPRPSSTLGATSHRDGRERPRMKGATSLDKSFDIYDLEFDCQYEVKIRPAASDGNLGPESIIHFFTHPCQAVVVKGRRYPNCSTPAPDMLPKPMNLSYIMVVNNSPEIECQFHWRSPELAPGLEISGYKVTWAEKMPSPDGLQGSEGFPVIDRRTENTRDLPQDKLCVTITQLKFDTHYVFQVQAFSELGYGAVAMKEFKTLSVHKKPIYEGDYTSGSRNSGYVPSNNGLETLTESSQKYKNSESENSGAASVRLSLWTFCLLVAFAVVTL